MLATDHRSKENERAESEALRLRYFELVGLGYSPETSLIVSESAVPLDSVTQLMLPDKD